jgi:transcriptional regulator GlxA family with amidase domain
MASDPAIEIGIVLYPGAQLAAVHGLIDLFGVADRFAAQHHNAATGFLRVSQWRAHDPGKAPMRDVDTDGSPAVLLLPPALNGPPTPADAKPFIDWLRSHHRAGTTLGAVCGGAFLLGETGLLAGRSVTTHWAHAEMFRSRFPEARLDTDRLVIDDGDIISAGAVIARHAEIGTPSRFKPAVHHARNRRPVTLEIGT